MNDLVRKGAIAFGIAVVVNVIIWAVARWVLEVPEAFKPLETVVPTIVATLIGAVGATAVSGLLQRVTSNPVRSFQLVALGFLAVSLVGPISQDSEPGGTGEAIGVLIAMHVLTTAVIVAVFSGWLERRSDV